MAKSRLLRPPRAPSEANALSLNDLRKSLIFGVFSASASLVLYDAKNKLSFVKDILMMNIYLGALR